MKVFSAPDSPVVLSNATMAPTTDGTSSGTSSGTTAGSNFLGGNNVNATFNATDVPANVTDTPVVSESDAEAPIVESNATDVEEPAPVVESPPAFPPKDTTDAMGSETNSALAGSGGAMNSVTSVVGIVGACVALALV